MGNWTIMGTADEREAFWRWQHEAWQRSRLNQREYCEAHGLVLKRFENWRAKFKEGTGGAAEVAVPSGRSVKSYDGTYD